MFPRNRCNHPMFITTYRRFPIFITTYRGFPCRDGQSCKPRLFNPRAAREISWIYRILAFTGEYAAIPRDSKQHPGIKPGTSPCDPSGYGEFSSILPPPKPQEDREAIMIYGVWDEFRGVRGAIWSKSTSKSRIRPRCGSLVQYATSKGWIRFVIVEI